MEPETAKKELLEYLDTAIDEVGVDEVIFGYDTPLLENALPTHPHSRIIMPLTGKKTLAVPLKDGIQNIELVSGQLIFTVKYGWTNPAWTTPHSMISIVYHKDYTRILYIDNQGNQIQQGPDLWFHTNRKIGDAGLYIIQALNSLAKNRDNTSPRDTLLAKALLYETKDELLKNPTGGGSKSMTTYQLLREYLNEHFHQPISRENISGKLGYNPSYISRLFKDYSGESLSNYLIRLRMEKAAHILANTAISIDEAAVQCGYNDTGYFIKAFRGYYGITPGKYRDRNH